MKKLILVSLLLVAVLLLIWWAKGVNFNVFSMMQAITPKTASPSAVVKQQSPTATPVPEEILITITPSGFVPNALMISPNTKITWVNKSTTSASIASDPVNAYQPLNLGNVDVNNSLSLTFTQPGRYTYENSQNPSQKGVLVVK